MSRNASAGRVGAWTRLVALAAAYGVSIFLYRRAVPDGLTSPWFVLVAMICFLGLAFFAAPIVPLRVPGAWRTVRGWEEEGRLYRALGVLAFGRLLRRTPLRLLNTQVYLRERGHDQAALTAQLEAAEASHLWAGLLVVPYMVYACIQEAWATVLWFAAAQLIGNAYPMAHLRLARARVDRIARTVSRRQAASACRSTSASNSDSDE